MKRILIFLLILFSFSLLVFAEPPPSVNYDGSVGYQIKAPIINPIQLNRDYEFHFHVFDLETGLPVDNSSSDCFFHLYNDTGNHIFQKNYIKNMDGLDWSVLVNAGNFSREGEYGYLFSCNSSTLGGFHQSLIAVKSYIHHDKNLPLIVGIIGISLIFLYFAFQLDKDHFLLKLALIFFSLASLILIPATFINGVSETVKILLRIPVGFFVVFSLYFGGYLFYHWTKKAEAWNKIWRK